ncbi:MAG: phosphoribosyltransferase family protein [Candidatus Glassbacteria bacterium]
MAVHRNLNEQEFSLAAVPMTGADCVRLLGEYRCGDTGHEYSARLMQFKDLKGTCGRAGDGRRLYADFFAALTADLLLADPELADYTDLAAVPPKIGQDPRDYHLFDLVREVERILLDRDRRKRLCILPQALGFVEDVPPLKSVELTRRHAVVSGRISCSEDFTGRGVVLIDDIVASGATAGECVRALKEAGASKVALLALAKRIG